MADNVQVIRSAYEAFARGDIPAVIELLDQGRVGGAEVLPQGGLFRGRDGAGEFFQRLGGAWEGLELELEDLLDAGDHVVGIGWAQGTLRGSGLAGYA